MQREPPQTEEGWYALHDMRSIDWDAWRGAPDHERERALAAGIDYLEAHEAVEDADEGQSAVYTVLGADADLLVVHLRPTMSALDTAERRFEQTAFAEFTERAESYVSVTEASGYTERSREYFEGEVGEDSGLAQYIQARLHPEIPDDEFVCFYPMSKRRQPDQNWYDLPFAERAEHIKRHGDIGREYGGKVEQMIAGSMGLDDWEWGITLWSEDVTHIKDLLARMRFDPSSSQFAEFGPFYIGRRFPPADLPAVLAGEPIPTGGAAGETATEAHATAATGADSHATTATEADAGGHGDAGPSGGAHPGNASQGDHPHGEGDHADRDHPAGEGGTADGNEGDGETGGRPPVGGGEFTEVDDLPARLAGVGLTEGPDYDAGDYGLVFYSGADAEDLAEDVSGLAENFDHYDRHVTTTVRANQGRTAVVSIWTAKDAAETAAGFLGDLADIEERYGGPLGEADDAGDDGATGQDEGASGDAPDEGAADIREALADLDVYAGKPHGEDVYALVLYSEADPAELQAAVADQRDHFDRHDTHVKTAVYTALEGDAAAVVSLWDTADAADTAAEHLADLPGVVGRPEDREGFGTVGMFYTVKPDYREEFRETFAEVGERLAEMDGHRETALLVNREDENDMFIASQWDAREDAMAFFRSEAFAETVEWGREVLEDRPRHVFLA